MINVNVGVFYTYYKANKTICRNLVNMARNSFTDYVDFLHSSGIDEELKAIRDNDGVKRLYF